MIDGHRPDAEVLVVFGFTGFAVGGQAVVPHDPQHVVAVLREACKRSVFLGQQGTGGVRTAGEDGGDRAADGPAFLAVVGHAGLHQHGAQVGVAEAEGAVLPAEFGDLR